MFKNMLQVSFYTRQSIDLANLV